MKKSVRVMFVLACVFLLATGVVYAKNTLQALPGSGWSTGIQVQNVGSGVAQIVLTGYDAAGNATYTDSTTGANTPVGGSRNYTTFPSGPTSFNGAGVFSSDQPIVAIVNINNAGSSGLAAGQYQGVDSSKTSTEVRFPLVKNSFNSKCTTFFVQNAGSTADKIYATFSNGSTWNSGTAVDPGDMVTIDPALATPAVPSTGPFALTVTSTQMLAGTVTEHFCTANTILQSTRGFGSSDGDSTLLAPIYKYKFPNTANARSTGLQVQNVGASAATITVTYACATCSFTQYQQNVPAGKSVTFFQNNIIAAAGGGATGSTGTALANGTLAAATVTSNGTIVAIVNESYDSVPAGYNQSATTYSAQSKSAASVKLGVPLVKEVFSNKTTGIQIQNAGASAATVKVTYVLNAGAAACQGTYVANNISIAPGASVTLNQLSSGAAVPGGGSWTGSAIKAGCFGGATIESTNAVKLVAIVNEADNNPTPSLQQDKKNYEAFPIQ